MKPRSAPRHLHQAGKALWRAVESEYLLNDSQRVVLEAAAVAADRLADARAEIDRRGVLIDGMPGHPPKANPALSVERDARSGLLQALRQLALEPDQPTYSTNRPPAIRPMRPVG